MSKLELSRPVIIMLYGFPGAGKTFFARQLCQDLQAAHLQIDRIRFELFDKPQYDKQEDAIVGHLARYMAEEFLNAGISVIYDENVMRVGQRRAIRQLASKMKAESLVAWLQIDIESAFARSVKRDHRKTDDKYAKHYDRTNFDSYVAQMQKPVANEQQVVISGKHNYQTQRAAVLKKLYDLGLVQATTATENLVKPGLVNLVPNSTGRVDPSRRNIFIR